MYVLRRYAEAGARSLRAAYDDGANLVGKGMPFNLYSTC